MLILSSPDLVGLCNTVEMEVVLILKSIQELQGEGWWKLIRDKHRGWGLPHTLTAKEALT